MPVPKYNPHGATNTGYPSGVRDGWAAPTTGPTPVSYTHLTLPTILLV